MARPPDGSSTWHHTADCHVLLDADGSTWARVHQPLAGGSLQLSLPYAGRKLDAYTLFEISVAKGRVTWRYRHPALASARKCTWTPETAPEDLVPVAEVRARGPFEGHVPDAPLVATLRASPGELRVEDSRGRCRVIFAVGRMPAEGGGAAAGALHDEGVVAVGFAFPTDAGTRVETHATSLP